jgi:hypothetical protein
MMIGVIAEEANDVDVLYEFTCKLVGERRFSFKHFVGHGCGKLRRKCSAWAENLLQRGCTEIVVVHDLDENDEGALRKELTRAIENTGCKAYVILIPTHELEAWLLVDAIAIQKVFAMAKLPRLPPRPETVPHPKEKLRDIVWQASRKRYVNTIHNRKIAAASRIAMLSACASFSPYPKFILGR